MKADWRNSARDFMSGACTQSHPGQAVEWPSGGKHAGREFTDQQWTDKRAMLMPGEKSCR